MISASNIDDELMKDQKSLTNAQVTPKNQFESN